MVFRIKVFFLVRTGGWRGYKQHTAEEPVEDRDDAAAAPVENRDCVWLLKWRTGASGHQGSLLLESWTGRGVDRTQIQRV